MIKFKIKQFFKMISQHFVFPVIYFFHRFGKVDEKLVIFADAHHDFCPPSMIDIRNKICDEHFTVKEFYIDSAIHSKKEAMRSMKDFMKMYPKAKYVFICDNYLPVSSCKKKKDTKVIQLWHGCGAFKKFGFDSTEDVPKHYWGNVYKNYDLVAVSGDACVKHFRTAMQNPDFDNKIVKPIGCASTDRFFNKDFIEACKDKFRYEFPDAVDKKVVLWAPTFRGNAGLKKSAKIIGEIQLDLYNFLESKNDVYFIESLHPHLLQDKNVNMTTEELMVCADVLITDYSSVFFEFLLMDKPILFYAPDYNSYTEDRGFYLKYDKLPGKIVKSKDELKEKLEGILSNDDMSDEREEYKKLYMNACDGTATQKIVDYVIDKL